MTVSDVLLQILAAHGVRHLYGIPGDAINDVMDAVRRQDAIRFVSVKHEEAGAFAAAAEAKLTGHLTACLGTSGPGGIHLLNGLYDAQLDHAPVLAITGQVATGFIGTQHHQEVDLQTLFADVSVYSQTLTTEVQVPDIFLEACHAAMAHNSVAHISLPTDVSGRSASLGHSKRLQPTLAGQISPTTADCEGAIDMINQAEKVVILAGIGCKEARHELIRFADIMKAPVVRSLRAKEVIDDDHPQCIGGLGMLGGKPAVRAMDECDLLIMVGTDFPYRDFYPEQARVIQIDIQSTRIGKRHAVDRGLVGHAGPTLRALCDQVEQPRDERFLVAMQNHMKHWLEQQSQAEQSETSPIQPPRLMHELSQCAPDEAIFMCDTGTVTAWTARHLRVRPGQRYSLSGGLASMAYALPGALAAQLVYPQQRVFALTGDGGFSMLMADFVTAVRYELPIIVIVLNNAKLAFITLEQEAKGLPDWGTQLVNTDFAAFARACGGNGFTVTQPDQITPTLKEAMHSHQPCVIDVIVDPDTLVMPPKINLAQAGRYGMAKVREAFSH